MPLRCTSTLQPSNNNSAITAGQCAGEKVFFVLTILRPSKGLFTNRKFGSRRNSSFIWTSGICYSIPRQQSISKYLSGDACFVVAVGGGGGGGGGSGGGGGGGLFICLLVCLFACLLVCLFVCLLVGWLVGWFLFLFFVLGLLFCCCCCFFGGGGVLGALTTTNPVYLL